MKWKSTRYIVALAAVFFLAGAAAWWITTDAVPAVSHAKEVFPVIILDAGHGGTDGGAVSADGIVESRLNLEITKRLSLLMAFCGHESVLTRTDEGSLASPDTASVKEEKRSDLNYRVSFVNAYSDAVLISIHQNSLPGHPEVFGAQVFFNTAPTAGRLAEEIQEQLNAFHNAGNEKLSRKIDASIYLMKEVTHPAVLVECGFLSNPTEAKLLCTEEYQKQLVLAVAAGYLSYTNEGIT